MADARARVVVAMSGGVDSSVAAALLVDAGHDVVGVSMQLYDAARGEERFGSCCTIDDLHDARRVAHALGIPHYIVNLERRFDEVVVANFVREYASGRTPIPCAHCNSALKFSTLVDQALGFDADSRGDRPLRPGDARRRRRVSSSSRRRRRQGPGVLPLRADAGATRPRHVPAGRHAEGRGAAHRRVARGLRVADKPDSQEICFVPDGDYAAVVDRQLPADRCGPHRRTGRSRRRAARRRASLHHRPAEGPRDLRPLDRSTW